MIAHTDETRGKNLDGLTENALGLHGGSRYVLAGTSIRTDTRWQHRGADGVPGTADESGALDPGRRAYRGGGDGPDWGWR